MSDGTLKVWVDADTGEQAVRGIDAVAVDRLLVGCAAVGQAFDVSSPTVRTWLKAGLIPAPRRVGRRLLWSVSELRDWISAGCLPCPPGEADVALGQSEAAR